MFGTWFSKHIRDLPWMTRCCHRLLIFTYPYAFAHGFHFRPSHFNINLFSPFSHHTPSSYSFFLRAFLISTLHHTSLFFSFLHWMCSSFDLFMFKISLSCRVLPFLRQVLKRKAWRSEKYFTAFTFPTNPEFLHWYGSLHIYSLSPSSFFSFLFSSQAKFISVNEVLIFNDSLNLEGDERIHEMKWNEREWLIDWLIDWLKKWKMNR